MQTLPMRPGGQMASMEPMPPAEQFDPSQMMNLMRSMEQLMNPMRGLGQPPAEPRQRFPENNITPSRTLKPNAPLFFRGPDGEMYMNPLEDPRFPIT